MDFKEIKNQKDSYSNEKKELRESMKKWLEKIVDEMGEIDLVEADYCSSVLFSEGNGDYYDSLCRKICKRDGKLVFCLDDDEECDFLSLQTDDIYWLCKNVSLIVEVNERNFPHIKVGGHVRWNDPAINDFEPEDQEDQLNLVWEIQQIDGTLIEDNTIIHITREDGGEAEVYAHELVPCMNNPLDLTPKQWKAWRKLKAAWKECKGEGIDFISACENLYPVNGNKVANYEFSEGFDFETDKPYFDLDEYTNDYLGIDVYSFSGDGFEDIAILK